jgi:hypothetical protein
MKRIPLKLEGVPRSPRILENSFFKKTQLQTFIGENKNRRVYSEEAFRLARGSGKYIGQQRMLWDAIYNSIEFDNGSRISYHAFEEGETARGATSRIFFTT